jgi:ssDNA-binding Zn-finger/Zn-ribbon topoisomerase 1
MSPPKMSRPKFTRFSGHCVRCPTCGHVSKAATLLVAQQKDREHAVECDIRTKATADADAARVAQGRLFE